MDSRSADKLNLDRLCRQVLKSRRVEAFDNIDVERFLARAEIPLSEALWIGRHMMLNSRNVDAYREGQEIIRLAKMLQSRVPA